MEWPLMYAAMAAAVPARLLRHRALPPDFGLS